MKTFGILYRLYGATQSSYLRATARDAEQAVLVLARHIRTTNFTVTSVRAED